MPRRGGNSAGSRDILRGVAASPTCCGSSNSAPRPEPGRSAEPPWRVAPEPAVDALDHLAVMAAKALLGDVAEMRRQHEIVELAIGMVDRQRFDRKHVERGARDPLLLQRLKQRLLVHDRRARGV